MRSHPAASAASYTLTDLGSLPGIELSAALALNAAGNVTGYAVRSDSPTAFVWDRTNGMTDLGVLPGDTASYGTGINANGDVCGISQGTNTQGFVWSQDGGMRSLAPLPTGTDTWACGINASGQVAGMSTYLGRNGKRSFAAVVWNAAGRIESLPVLQRSAAGAAAIATAINDAGQVTGYQGIMERGSVRSQSFVWDAVNGLKALVRPAGGSGRAVANNALGQVFGLSATARGNFPASWAPTGDGRLLDADNALADVGSLRHDLGGINSAGQIVYSLNGNEGGVATLQSGGASVDLNQLADAASGVHLYTAAAINDSGQIVGALTANGSGSSAYLLTPDVTASAAMSVAAVSPVNLRTAGNYALLTKTGITNTGATKIVGNLGVSPIASTAITGFGLIKDSTGRFSTSTLVTGKVYAANYATPTPSNLTTAISDMQTAYSDAAARTSPTATELGAGNIGGKIIAPGLYKWSSNVIIPANVTLSGPSSGVWIFQIAGSLNISSGKQVILSGGANAANIFWQVAGQTTLETYSVMNGNILDKTAVVIKTGAKLNGRALAQTAVTLDANAITRPLPPPPATPSALVARAVSATQVDVTWRDGSTGETQFRVERKVGAGSYTQIAVVYSTTSASTGTGYRFTAGGLSLTSTTYSFRVRAYGGSYSAYTYEAVVPINPDSLTVAAPPAPAGRTQLNLAWRDRSANEQGFEVFRSRDGYVNSFVMVTRTAANVRSYANTGLAANTLYYYKVRAVSRVGSAIVGYSWYSPMGYARTRP